MTFDPKMVFIFNAFGLLLSILINASGNFPDYISPAMAGHIVSTAAFLMMFYQGANTLFAAFSSSKPGPFVPMPPVPPKLPIVMLAIFAGALLMFAPEHASAASVAHAQKHVAAMPVKALPNINTIIGNLKSMSIADLQAADLDAQNQGDHVADQCYVGLISVLSAQQAASALIAEAQAKDGAPQMPKVPIFLTFQQFRDFVVSLRVGSPVKTACAPLADEMKTDVTTLVTQIVAGSFSWASVAPIFGL